MSPWYIVDSENQQRQGEGGMRSSIARWASWTRELGRGFDWLVGTPAGVIVVKDADL